MSSSAPPETDDPPPATTAAAAAAAKTSYQHLTVTYNSPTNAPFTHTAKLPFPTTSSTADRVAYLSALRKATVELQEKINSELTSRMEQDKARDAAGAVETAKSKGVVDEGKEEEYYGEEVAEDED